MGIARGHIWLVDFEFHQPDGEVPRPICMVARNFGTGVSRREWLWDSTTLPCPIPLGPPDLYVAYMASAELGCHLELGWPLPVHVLDLSAEFRQLTAGSQPSAGGSLLGALEYFGIRGMDVAEKEEFRGLAIRGGPYGDSERQGLLDYCESDVVALAALLPKMAPHIDLPRALIRGRYMKAVAKMERLGIPVAAGELETIRHRWDEIRPNLVAQVDRDYGVYEGTSFRRSKFMDYCVRQEIPWPNHESGVPDLRDETFKTMSLAYPQLCPLRELRSTLLRVKPDKLSVGRDGRNRCLTGTFGSKTGRNQPSSNKFIFGQSRWIRHLIKPGAGMAVAYVDYSQQEFGIAAALSQDAAMMDAYRSGDPYLEFAKLADAVPGDATRATHPGIRDQYKVAALGILMGMGGRGLGVQTGTCEATGHRLLRQHQEIFRDFWRWSDAQVDRANLGDRLVTTFGWTLRSRDDSGPTLRNFKLQATGAEILRVAAIAITERDIPLCAMIHDAVLIEAPIVGIEDAVSETRRLMAEASEATLGGFEIRTDAEIFRHPDRYRDEKGRDLWDRVAGLEALRPRSTSCSS